MKILNNKKKKLVRFLYFCVSLSFCYFLFDKNSMSHSLHVLSPGKTAYEAMLEFLSDTFPKSSSKQFRVQWIFYLWYYHAYVSCNNWKHFVRKSKPVINMINTCNHINSNYMTYSDTKKNILQIRNQYLNYPFVYICHFQISYNSFNFMNACISSVPFLVGF